MTPLLEAALGYARNLSWPVFPLAPWRKAPPLIEAWPEHATADPEIISGWWATWPTANVALHCINLVVVDVDARNNGRAALDSLISNSVGCRRPSPRTHPTAGMRSSSATPVSVIRRAN